MNRNYAARVSMAVIGILFTGIGIAFNAGAALGNDPIGILYDGLRNILGLSGAQMGTASNIVNITFAAIVLVLNRKYINIGTLIYVLPYGTVVNFGSSLYNALFTNASLLTRIGSAVLGCGILYLGIAMFIVADIGLDPFTGFVMAICDKIHKEYRSVKVVFDFCCIVIGFVLGGKLGMITIITASLAGPLIQILTNLIRHIAFERKTLQTNMQV